MSFLMATCSIKLSPCSPQRNGLGIHHMPLVNDPRHAMQEDGLSIKIYIHIVKFPLKAVPENKMASHCIKQLYHISYQSTINLLKVNVLYMYFIYYSFSKYSPLQQV